MNYFSIGYPLGFFKSNKYALERINTEPILLSESDFKLWRTAFYPEIDGDYASLIRCGALISFANANDLFNKISMLHPIHVGIGWFKDEKICILRDSSYVYLTKVNYNIWVNCNGVASIQEIYDKMQTDYHDDTASFIHILCSGLICLMRSGLLYIR